MINDPGVVFEYLGGMAPVQAEGTVDGQPFYFRSRGAKWSMGIGEEPVLAPDWEHTEPFGEWPDAGYITKEQALEFIEKSVKLYREQRG